MTSQYEAHVNALFRAVHFSRPHVVVPLRPLDMDVPFALFSVLNRVSVIVGNGMWSRNDADQFEACASLPLVSEPGFFLLGASELLILFMQSQSCLGMKSCPRDVSKGGTCFNRVLPLLYVCQPICRRRHKLGKCSVNFNRELFPSLEPGQLLRGGVS